MLDRVWNSDRAVADTAVSRLVVVVVGAQASDRQRYELSIVRSMVC